MNRGGKRIERILRMRRGWKKKLSLLLSFALVLSAFSMTGEKRARASVIEYNENGFIYDVDVDNNTAVLKGYRGQGAELQIPSTVTVTGSAAVPVTGISDYAFAQHAGVTSVEVPGSVTSIGDYAFSYCGDLASIYLTENIVSLGVDAFAECINLTVYAPFDSHAWDYAVSAGLQVNEIPPIGTPTASPTDPPAATSTGTPTASPTDPPAATSTGTPTASPTDPPTASPTEAPTASPVETPTPSPVSTQAPTEAPTASPVETPTPVKTSIPAPTQITTGLPVVTQSSPPAPEWTVTPSITPAPLKKGETAVVAGVRFTGIDSGSVTLSAGRKDTKKLIIPATVRIQGRSYAVTKIADKAFAGAKCTSVSVGNNIVSIGKSAFKNCRKLKEVSVPNSVKKIGNKAFMGCKRLKTVIIGTKKTVNAPALILWGGNNAAGAGGPVKVSLGTDVFKNCLNLKKVIINALVRQIGANTFYNCKKLAKLIVKSLQLKVVGKNALKGVNNCTITVPRKKFKPYTALFRNKGQGKKCVMAKA